MQKKFLPYLFLFLSLAFLTNFLWESLHGIFLYESLDILGVERYVQLMLDVSLKDMFWLGLTFIGLGIYYRDPFWFCSLKQGKYLALFFVPFVIAVLIELQGVFVFQKWSYSPLMPQILGLGLSPLLELPATMFFCILVVRGIKTRK